MLKSNFFLGLCAGCTMTIVAFLGYDFISSKMQKSTEFSEPRAYPGNRYSRENLDSDILAHWQDKLSIQFLNINEIEVMMTSLTTVMSLKKAAGVAGDIVGFPNYLFGTNGAIDPKTNLLIFEYESESLSSFTNGTVKSVTGSLDLTRANESIKAAFKLGFIEQSTGCLARWQATPKNEIQAAVIGISRSIPQASKVACIEKVAPFMFGIASDTTAYAPSINGISLAPEDKYFDKSEVLFALSVADFCRKKFHDFTANCPYRLIGSIYSYHEEERKFFVGD